MPHTIRWVTLPTNTGAGPSLCYSVVSTPLDGSWSMPEAGESRSARGVRKRAFMEEDISREVVAASPDRILSFAVFRCVVRRNRVFPRRSQCGDQSAALPSLHSSWVVSAPHQRMNSRAPLEPRPIRLESSVQSTFLYRHSSCWVA
jgi:hypothetical protein